MRDELRRGAQQGQQDHSDSEMERSSTRSLLSHPGRARYGAGRPPGQGDIAEEDARWVTLIVINARVV